jgi:hypothetical protein
MISTFLKKSNATVLILLAVLAGCNSKHTQKNEEDAVKDTSETSLASTAEKIVYSIPSPLRSVSLLKRAGGHYVDGIVNSPDNVKSYVTNNEMSFNLGVYGADLAYTSLYDQTQVSIKCMKACKILAENIGISNAFMSNNLLSRFESNLSNKDSLLMIISELYRESGNYLRENDNNSGAALMLAGGWVESLYIGTKTNEKNNKKELAQRISEQKGSLKNLIGILSDYKDQQGFNELLKDLEDLNTVFGKGTEQYNNTEQKATNEKTKEVELDAGVTYSITNEQLHEISKKIETIRNKMVKHI